MKSNLTDPFDLHFFQIEFIEINCQMIIICYKVILDV